MRTRRLFLGLASLFAFSSCSNDEINSEIANDQKKELIQSLEDHSLMNDVRTPSEELRACLEKAKKWTTGQEITYGFINGTDYQKKAV